MIKVIANNAAQAIEIINSFKNKNDLTVVIKENTATENSDVSIISDRNKIKELIIKGHQ